MTWRPLVAPGVCWLTAALLGAASVATAVLIAATAAIGACWAAMAAREQLRGTWRVLLLVAAVAVTAVAVSSAVRAHTWHGPPWPQWVEQRASVEVVLRLTQTPVRVANTPWADGAEKTVQTARAVVVTASGSDGTWSTNARVTARVPGDATDIRLRRGDQIQGMARVAPGDQRTGLAARLNMLEVDAVQPDTGWSGRVDRAFRGALSGLGPDEAALVQGLALGEDADLSPAARDDVRMAGLGHLTAVSGANIAMVVGVAMWAARAAGASRSVALVPAAVAMCGYVWLVGPEPSVVRAAAMATVALAGVLLGGGSGVAALASAVTVLLVWDPGLASSRGFALSCAATLGLISAAPTGRRLIKRWGERLPGPLVIPMTVVVAALVTAVAAAAATAPLLASYGEGVSWAAVAANVLVAPVVPVVTIGGLAVGAASLLSTATASILAWVPGAGAWWIVTVAQWATGLPGGRIGMPGTWQSGVLVAAGLVLVGLLTRRWPRAPALAAVAAVVAAVGQATLPPVMRGVPPDWTVVFCDVGQGDATLLRSGPDSAVLVDAGPEPSAALQCLRRVGVAHVDAVILSHFHRDHVEGFAEVASTHAPEAVWVSPLADPPPQATAVRAAATAAGTRVSIPAPGQTQTWGLARVETLGPLRLINEGSAANNASLVIVAEVTSQTGSVRVLLAGDVEPEAQAAVMSTVSDPRVDVAKVPHHGSANQHPAFPRWAQATWAVVSCGSDNDYGHPADTTLRDWQTSGATTLRTDRHGDVFVSIDASGAITASVTASVTAGVAGVASDPAAPD